MACSVSVTNHNTDKYLTTCLVSDIKFSQMHVVLMLRFASTLPIIGEFVGSGEIVLGHAKLSG